jgi:hypothetical protein
LKKRTKKLLQMGPGVWFRRLCLAAVVICKSFLVLFFKKELLTFLAVGVCVRMAVIVLTWGVLARRSPFTEAAGLRKALRNAPRCDSFSALR